MNPASWPGRRFQQRLRLGTEGLQLLLLLCGQLALVFLTPADRAVVLVPGLGTVVELMMAHGQEEGVETEVLAGCEFLGLFDRLDRRLPFSQAVVGDAKGVPVQGLPRRLPDRLPGQLQRQ